jgi:hypothetical protein
VATTTPRIGLTKPDGTDLVDVAVLNTNFDKIDSNIASTKIQATKPTTANAGDLWWDSNTGTLYLYYVDANSAQWVAATSDPVNIGVVASQSERDAQYPTPGQGMSVYRTDLGYRENYYGLYNVSTNPGGKTPAGWYREGGQVLQVVSGVSQTGIVHSTTTFVDTTLSATITPRHANSQLIVLVSQAGLNKSSGSAVNGLWLQLVKNGTPVQIFGYAMGLNFVAQELYIGEASTIWTEATVGTTSPITYKTQIRNETNASSVSAQGGGARSVITILEVSA